ncbi:MAG: DEAD/DEAH box helicase [Methanoregula sp.]|nr:DEAD/DEAH box helicase [Methanoregula sp.]
MKPPVNETNPVPQILPVPKKPLPVIHGSVNSDGTFFFWGEGPVAPIVKKRGRKPLQPKPNPHPYALPAAELKTALSNVLPRHLAITVGSITLTLPTTDTGPAPSPELAHELMLPCARTSLLTPWTVPVISVPIAFALPLLLSGNEFNKDARYGSSLAAWSVVALFTCELIASGSFAPAIAPAGAGTTKGVWRPDLRDEDKDRVRDLVKAMPPVVRAHLVPGEKGATLDGLVKKFIDAAMQAIVRQVASSSRPGSIPRQPAGDLPAEELFYRSLTGEDCTLPEKSPITKDLKKWLTGPIHSKKGSHCTTCFTVREPSRDELTWSVGFFLQSKDDPTLLVPAGEVWEGRSPAVAQLISAETGHPQERMLYDLGTAAKVYPPIREALKTARPEGITLPPESVYTFLSETAPLLRELGCSVLLPSWWKQGRQRPSIHLTVDGEPAKKGSGTGQFSLDSILSFNWKIAIGDEEITPEEFEQLANRKIPLMKVRGRWIIFDPNEARRVISAFKKEYPDSKMTLSDALALSLGGNENEDYSIAQLTPEGHLSEFMDRLLSIKAPEPVTLPPTFTGTLRPYQENGTAWLSMLTGTRMGACLADDMGLGKTVQLIAHLTLQATNGSRKTTLLVCPMSIIGNWVRELQRFAPSLRHYVHHGIKRCSGAEFSRARESADLVITSYQTVQRDEELFASCDWDCVVLDEAQNIKNHATKQARAVRKIPAGSRIVLTGTPVENRLFELWSIMDFLNPGYLGSAASFQKQFSIPIEKHHDTGKAQILKQIVRPFLLRRLKTDKTIIDDLPEKMIAKEFCPLTKEQASLYEAAVQDMLEKLDTLEGIERKGAVLVTLMRLKQICDHPALFLNDESELALRSGKVDRLCEVLEEVLANDERALVFTQYATFGEMLKPYLEKVFSTEVLFLSGKTKREARDEMVARFADRKGPKIFVLSLKAGGTGLNLTSANHVFHIDRWWNPAVEDQATDRAFRIGQTKNVEVHLMISAGTLEEKIDAVLEDKRALAGSIVGSGEDWITNLSTQELRELLTLRKDTLGGA